jgi:hypothetical protein
MCTVATAVCLAVVLLRALARNTVYCIVVTADETPSHNNDSCSTALLALQHIHTHLHTLHSTNTLSLYYSVYSTRACMQTLLTLYYLIQHGLIKLAQKRGSQIQQYSRVNSTGYH